MEKAHINLQQIDVWGVDTLARARTLRQWVVKRQSMRPKRIPILRKVTFEAKAGDRIAFLGRNGSGKSSLLKVISGNYPIHAGTREVTGSVVPLIEMGAGFETELTGRANIKLSFAYRGRLREYSRALEEKIIEFSELSDKIDTPLKTYSSGMVSRLAFSSAVFQNPDILLLDEVLAAGDAGFAQKSASMLRDKMDEAHITIIVSHNIDDMVRLCNRFVLLDAGRIIADGAPDMVIARYEQEILHLAKVG